MKDLNPTIPELVKLGDGIGGTKLTGVQEEIHEVLKQAFEASKAKSLQEYNPKFAKILNENMLELF